MHGVAFSPDGKLLATAGADGTIRLWNPATGQAVGAPLPADTGAGPAACSAVAFSPDGKLLATAGADGTVRLWNPATGRLRRGPSRPIPDRLAACTGWRSAPTASCWPAPTATAPSGCGTRPPARPPARPSRLIPARCRRARGGVQPGRQAAGHADDDGTVRLWNPATGQPIGAPIQTGTSSVRRDGVAFSPDGKLLATADGDGTVRLWNPATGQPVGAPIRASDQPA